MRPWYTVHYSSKALYITSTGMSLGCYLSKTHKKTSFLSLATAAVWSPEPMQEHSRQTAGT